MLLVKNSQNYSKKGSIFVADFENQQKKYKNSH